MLKERKGKSSGNLVGKISSDEEGKERVREWRTVLVTNTKNAPATAPSSLFELLE